MKRKQKIEIEVDIPDGWEVVRYGPAKKGEHYIGGEKVRIATLDFANEACYFIVRPAWQWPSWLKAEWIAMTHAGDWYAFQSEPTMRECDWGGYAWHRIDFDFFDFTPPTCTDWRQSKRRRPSCQSSE